MVNNRYDILPDELKKLNQWVVCKPETKCPFNARTGYAASSSSANTWSSFDDAIKALDDSKYSEIGFVFDDNNIVGIDIDAGFDGDGLITEMACDIIDVCQSYTEYSRSGRGFHIFIKGTLPFKGKIDTKGIEIYKQARYFVVTGKPMIYTDITQNQLAINYILSKYFNTTLAIDDFDFAPAQHAQPQPTRSHEFRKVTYKPRYVMNNGKAWLYPDYGVLSQGHRTLSLLSWAGQISTTDVSPNAILEELIQCNKEACNPPLDIDDLEKIVKSVCKYRYRY
jgi:hypothetical protein